MGIVVTDDNGDIEYSIAGGPEFLFPTDADGHMGKLKDKSGTWKKKRQDYDAVQGENSGENISNISTIENSLLIYDNPGESTAAIVKTLKDIASSMDGTHKYQPGFVNSNSFIMTLLRRAGLLPAFRSAVKRAKKKRWVPFPSVTIGFPWTVPSKPLPVHPRHIPGRNTR